MARSNGMDRERDRAGKRWDSFLVSHSFSNLPDHLPFDENRNGKKSEYNRLFNPSYSEVYVCVSVCSLP